MKPDPVVQEVREHGERLARECEGDVRLMAKRLRRGQAKSASRVVKRRTEASTRSDQESTRKD
jgi:hypothetical protein